MKRVVVISGAGISAESGLKTFRGADGLWRGYRPEEVACPEAWRRNRRRFGNNATCACECGLGDWLVCRTVGPAIA